MIGINTYISMKKIGILRALRASYLLINCITDRSVKSALEHILVTISLALTLMGGASSARIAVKKPVKVFMSE